VSFFALFFNAARSIFLLFFCYHPFGTHPTSSSSKLRQQQPSFPSEEEETDEQEEEEESSSQSMTRC
jgi:hypothetical protein